MSIKKIVIYLVSFAALVLYGTASWEPSLIITWVNPYSKLEGGLHYVNASWKVTCTDQNGVEENSYSVDTVNWPGTSDVLIYADQTNPETTGFGLAAYNFKFSRNDPEDVQAGETNSKTVKLKVTMGTDAPDYYDYSPNHTYTEYARSYWEDGEAVY